MTPYELTPAVWPVLASAGLMLALAALLWRHREMRGAVPLTAQAVLVTLMFAAIAAETAATEPASRHVWFLVRDALVLPAGIVILWFALEYASLERLLTRGVVAALVGTVLVHVALYLPADGTLLWSGVWAADEARGELAPLGIAFSALSLGLFVLATVILLVLFVRSPAHRAPVALILIGHVAVRILYPITTLKIVELPNAVNVAVLDFGGLMYAVALLRFRLFDLLPVARQTILERMPDAMLVLDVRNRVADLNDTAVRLLGLDRRSALERPVTAVLESVPDVARSVAAASEGPAEARFDTGNGPRSAEVTSTPLTDWQGQPIGRLVLLHDTSALREVEQRLVEHERALAAAEERERMARELHDGLAQDLWLAKLKCGRLAAVPDLNAEVRALTGEITAAVDAGLEEARHAVAAIRQAGEGGSLVELLARSLEDFEDRYGLSVEFDCDAPLPALSPRAEAEALRIAHEALVNVSRHADATVVRVRAVPDDGRVALEIRDNGRGFNPDAIGPGAYGLIGMRERASAVGGVVEIESAARKGTRVRLVLPAAVPGSAAAGAR